MFNFYCIFILTLLNLSSLKTINLLIINKKYSFGLVTFFCFTGKQKRRERGKRENLCSQYFILLETIDKK